MKQLNIDDYVVCVAGPFVGRKGLVTEIDPDGIGVVDFNGREFVCSYAQLHKVEQPGELRVRQICKSCNTSLPVDAFYKNKNYKAGYDRTCKECRRASARDRMKAERFPNRQRSQRRKRRNALIDELLGLLTEDVLSNFPDQFDTADRVIQILDELKGTK